MRDPWILVALAGWALAGFAWLSGRVLIVFDSSEDGDPHVEETFGLLALTLEELTEILGRRVTRDTLYMALEEIKTQMKEKEKV
jgi:hypothetical protein